ncbi:MAG: hypothetical protein CK551_01390 [Planctomycetaceae bacterium]|nr:MAG: hypothetical protein CK551_01390 [Planctomycetaceae bacterium]
MALDKDEPKNSLKLEVDPTWGKLPSGMKFGLGCAVVVDGKDRIIVTSRSTNPCVAIFDIKGTLLETWDKDISSRIGYDQAQFNATAHGLYWSKEPEGEFLYWTENVSKGKDGKKLGARIYKTDMNGKILFEIGNVANEGSKAIKWEFANPTDVAVSPNGDIYIVDGYGSQKVFQFDKNFKHLKTIGGPGKDHGKFNTCHGVWVSTLNKEPELYIADRGNNRLEVLSLEMEYKRTVEGVRTPCCLYQHDGHLYVPELGSRVTVIDAKDKIVTQMGDGSGIKDDIGMHPGKFKAPHALTLDSKGNLYVLEWLGQGRIQKFNKG